jgi:hypothetical protein
MLSQALSWLSRSPRVRRAVIKTWRAFLRVQRASLAYAVLVVRRQDDHVLALTSEASGELRLPSMELDGWRPVGTQVQEWLDHMLRRPSTIRLQAIDGTPGRKGALRSFIRRTSMAHRRKLAASGLKEDLHLSPSPSEIVAFSS